MINDTYLKTIIDKATVAVHYEHMNSGSSEIMVCYVNKILDMDEKLHKLGV